MSEMPSHFIAVCPNCLVGLKIRLAYSGSNVRCKHCEYKFRALEPDRLMTPASDEFPTVILNDSDRFEQLEGQPEWPQSADAEPHAMEQARLGNTEAQRDQLNERIADHARALESSHAQTDELVEQIRRRDSELATKLDELQRLANLRQADAAKADELRGTLVRREQEFQRECEELRGQIDELHRTLVSTEQAHGDERNRLEEQHHLARNQLESARSEIGVLQARAETSAQLAARLKAEILTIAQTRSTADADLEAAREEIADLRAKLADTENSKRSMSSLLEGMGILLD
jgi:chromosome segregation ATPase